MGDKCENTKTYVLMNQFGLFRVTGTCSHHGAALGESMVKLGDKVVAIISKDYVVCVDEAEKVEC